MRPPHEGVQAPERRDPLRRWPQHQMIGIAEQNLRAGRADVVVMHALDRRLRADRHESRRVHEAVRRHYLARAGSAVGGSQAEGKRVRHGA